MAIKIVWTPQALKGLDEIIQYLEDNWTDKEIEHFISEIDSFISLLEKYPGLLQKSGKNPNLYRGPINKHTILTYRFKPRKQVIELVNLRSTRKRPL